MIQLTLDRNHRTIRDSSNVCVLLVANKLQVASLDYAELGKFALVGSLRVSYNYSRSGKAVTRYQTGSALRDVPAS